MNIFVCDVEDWEKERFKHLENEHQLDFCADKLGEAAEIPRDVEVLSVFIYSKLGADILRKMPKLEMIATRSTGADHIDLEYCREHNITVSNVPSYGENTVAEHVFALLLNISHRLFESLDRTRRGDFSQTGLQGFDLQNKTIGVVGTGSIGAYVIEIARGFRMDVLAYDVKPDEELQRRLSFRYLSLGELLEQSDIISFHVPLNDKTRHMISAPQFQQMKQGVILINTSRGGIIDSQGLVEALADGRVAAAGLDVLPEEPYIREEAEMLRSVFREEHNLENLLADHLLLRLRNVYITPHNAFNTKEAVERIIDTTIENIVSFAGGKRKNAVV